MRNRRLSLVAGTLRKKEMRAVGFFLFIALLLSSLATAQEASLVDILATKGVLSKKEAQKLRKGAGAKTGGDQQALINLLRKKGLVGAFHSCANCLIEADLRGLGVRSRYFSQLRRGNEINTASMLPQRMQNRRRKL